MILMGAERWPSAAFVCSTSQELNATVEIGFGVQLCRDTIPLVDRYNLEDAPDTSSI